MHTEHPEIPLTNSEDTRADLYFDHCSVESFESMLRRESFGLVRRAQRSALQFHFEALRSNFVAVDPLLIETPDASYFKASPLHNMDQQHNVLSPIAMSSQDSLKSLQWTESDTPVPSQQPVSCSVSSTDADTPTPSRRVSQN